MTDLAARLGVRLPGGRLHVRYGPVGRRVSTSCGRRWLSSAGEEVPVDDVPPEARCRRCFPGSGRPAAPLPDPVDNS